jgi:hypothetical protein
MHLKSSLKKTYIYCESFFTLWILVCCSYEKILLAEDNPKMMTPNKIPENGLVICDQFLLCGSSVCCPTKTVYLIEDNTKFEIRSNTS